MTNADKIRQMSEDELADFLMKLTGGEKCPPWNVPICRHDDETCAECWFRWLDSEVGS